MPKYLTHAAKLKCNHEGMVVLPPSPGTTFHSNGSPVTTVDDLLSSASIVGCKQGGDGKKPCTRVVQILVGKARNVATDGKDVLLTSVRAMTDGVPPGTVTVFDDGAPTARTGGFQVDWSVPPEHWIAIELVDDRGVPVGNQRYSIEDGPGPVLEGYLDERGRAFVPLQEGGNHRVSFPDLNGESWKLVSSSSRRSDD
jgi:hypothetical protein